MATWRLWTKNDATGAHPGQGAGAAELAARLRGLPTCDYEHVGGGKLPRNHTPRAYRLSAGRDILGAVVVQFRRMRNCLEVGAMLYAPGAEPPLLAELLVFVLTEAYRCSGSCALRFARPRAAEALEAVGRLAGSRGIELRGEGDLDITVAEGRRLYLAFSGFSVAARGVVERLDEAGRARVETICYLVNSGVWSAAEMEGILLACPYPDAVLWGGARPADRQIALLAMDHARAAVLGGRLDRFLASRWEERDNRVRSLVTEPREIEVRVAEPPGTRRYRAGPEPVPFGDWRRSPEPSEIPAGGDLVAWVLSRSREDVTRGWDDDLREAGRAEGFGAPGTLTAFVVPSDFDQLGVDVRRDLLGQAGRAGVGILVAPDTFPQVSLEARRRLKFSRTIRR